MAVELIGLLIDLEILKCPVSSNILIVLRVFSTEVDGKHVQGEWNSVRTHTIGITEMVRVTNLN